MSQRPLPFTPIPVSFTFEATSYGEASCGDDSYLRSTKNLAGYEIHTNNGSIGHVVDFMIDDKTWAVRHLVIETGHWYYGKEVVISPGDIDRISFEESAVFVKVTKEAIRNALEYQMPRAQYHDAWELIPSAD